MQPTILDNDVVIVSTSRSPRHRDIVVIRANGPHPVYGPIDGYVWRYHARSGDLGKDNPRYRDRQPVMPEEIVGVVTRILPRAYRDEQENYLRIQQHRALSQACNIKDPPDLGFYRQRDLRELRAIFQIPADELVTGRLPWGLFRATTLTNHPHVGVTTQDVLTVEPTIESCTGQLVVKRNDDGETILGVLQRDGLRSRHPGEFFIETDERRINVSRDDGHYPLYRHRRHQAHPTARRRHSPAAVDSQRHGAARGSSWQHWSRTMTHECTRRSLLQLLGISIGAAAVIPAHAQQLVVEPCGDGPIEFEQPLSSPTRLERYIRSHGLKPAHLARESGYSRQHLLRLRFGRMRPSLTCIAALVIALRRLTNKRVTAEDLFAPDDIQAAWHEARGERFEEHEQEALRAAFGRPTLRALLNGAQP